MRSYIVNGNTRIRDPDRRINGRPKDFANKHVGKCFSVPVIVAS